MGKTSPSSRLAAGGSGRLESRTGFTLIELVVVLGVMALLMTVVMPAFTGMAGAQGVKANTRVLMQKLKLARAFAVDNHERVALLTPTYSDLSTISAGQRTKYANRTYRACLVEYDGSQFNFKRWINGEKWDFLTSGIIIADIDDDIGYDAGDFSNAEEIQNVDCDDIGGSGSTNMHGVVFTPTGKCTNDAYVVVANDVLDSSGKRVKGKNSTSPNRKKDSSIKLDKFTGRVSLANEY